MHVHILVQEISKLEIPGPAEFPPIAVITWLKNVAIACFKHRKPTIMLQKMKRNFHPQIGETHKRSTDVITETIFSPTQQVGHRKVYTWYLINTKLTGNQNN